jgi:exosortase N
VLQQNRFAFSIVFILLASSPILSHYMVFEFQTILALILAPFAFKPRYPNRFRQRYFFISLILLILYFLCSIKIFYLFGVGTAILAIVENKRGQLSELPLLFLLLISPILHYAINIFTFPIRLKFSDWSGKILQFAGMPIRVSGNFFEWTTANHQTFSFSVDTACIGLNLMHTGLTALGLWLGFSENQFKKRLPLHTIIALFLITIFLLLIANLLRITLLVYFRSMPHTWSHELLGLSCLMIYVLVPLYFLIPYVYQKIGVSLLADVTNAVSTSPKFWDIGLIGIILSAYLWTKPIQQDFKTKNLILNDFKKEIVEDNVVKFTNDSILIYIKPPARFWGSDHSPTICWAGSGFEFTKIQPIQIEKHEIYTGILQKDSILLHTAWWYDNGLDKTIEQSRWRLQAARGREGYRLINITTKDTALLRKQCIHFLKQNLWISIPTE